MKIALCSGISRSCKASALSQSPASVAVLELGAEPRRDIGGDRDAAAPPWALKPSAVASSPESWMKSGPQVMRCSETRSILPVASFTPTMFLKSCASRPIVSGVMSITERGGML